MTARKLGRLIGSRGWIWEFLKEQTMKRIIYACVATLLLGMFSLVSAADATGKWVAELPGRNGNAMKTTFTFKAEGATLTGTVSGRNGDTPIENGKIDGNTITFEVTRSFNGNTFTSKYTGKLGEDNKLSLSWSSPNGQTREATATREH
jgi:hypothetical protein